MEGCNHEEAIAGHKNYCAVEARDPDGCAPLVAELCDFLLDPNLKGAFDRIYSYDKDGVWCSANFAFLHSDTFTYALPLTEKEVTIECDYERQTHNQTYTVKTGWRVCRSDAPESFFTARYSFFISGSGKVEGEIYELNPETGQYEERELTDYDYQVLFEELTDLQNLCGVVGREYDLINDFQSIA